MKIKLTLDRFEGKFGVCIDADGNKYDIPILALADLKENDIFLASFDGESFSEIELLQKETEEKKEAMRSRLNKLFERSKSKGDK